MITFIPIHLQPNGYKYILVKLRVPTYNNNSWSMNVVPNIYLRSVGNWNANLDNLLSY